MNTAGRQFIHVLVVNTTNHWLKKGLIDHVPCHFVGVNLGNRHSHCWTFTEEEEKGRTKKIVRTGVELKLILMHIMGEKKRIEIICNCYTMCVNLNKQKHNSLLFCVWYIHIINKNKKTKIIIFFTSPLQPKQTKNKQKKPIIK